MMMINGHFHFPFNIFYHAATQCNFLISFKHCDETTSSIRMHTPQKKKKQFNTTKKVILIKCCCVIPVNAKRQLLRLDYAYGCNRSATALK